MENFWPIGKIRGKLIIKTAPNVVVDLLIYLIRNKHYQVSNIKGYRSMISKTIKLTSKSGIRTHPVLSVSVTRSLAPKGDLLYVLTYLGKEPFELLKQASLIYLSMNAAFLLATVRC